MNRLEETRGTKFELTRHFLGRMFESDIFAVRGQWQNVALSAAAAILPVGILFGDYFAKYRYLARLSTPAPFRNAALVDYLSIIVLAMSVSGLVALLQWNSLYPGKRDYFSLAGLPIRSRQIFIARFAAVALFTTAFVVVLNILPSLVIPLQIAGRWQKNPSLIVNVVAQTVAVGLGCYFVFFAAMALHGVLLHVLRPKLYAHVSTSIQAVGIAVCFFAALFAWTIGDWDASAIETLRRIGGFVPPVWFLGLHERILGDRDAFFAVMSHRALFATAAALAISALAYALGSRRYRKLLVENPHDVPLPRRFDGTVLHWIAGDPRREAVMQFMARTLARSRVHRTVFLAYVGAALGFVVNSLLLSRGASHLRQTWYEAIQFTVLFAPIALSAVILPGFRHVCCLPAELPANWMFQTTEHLGRKQWMSALERFVIFCVVGPIYLVFAPIAVSVLGWPLALRMITLQLLISLLMFEVLFDNWQQLPFACSYVPGKRPMMALLARVIGVLGLVVPLLSVVVRSLSEFPMIFALVTPLLVGMWIWARRRRHDGWGDVKLTYEDRPHALPNLGLGELTYRADPAHIGDAVRNDDSSAGPDFYDDRGAQRLAGSTPESVESSGAPDTHAYGGICGPTAPATPVSFTLRLYRALARAFPYEFKCAYEEELLQVTEDAVEPIWRHHGVLGVVRLLADIAIRVPVEYVAQFWRDLRYALRVLLVSPGFTVVAVLSLALGISIATCAFSEMNGMVLRSLPQAAQPDELVGFQAPVSFRDYRRYRQLNNIFSSTMAYAAPVPFGVSFGAHTERVWANLVTSSYFSTLGVRPLLGHAFGPQEDTPGASPMVMISYRFWQARLGGAPDVVGKTLRLNGHTVTIVGVGPRDFLGASPALFAADLWMPVFAAEPIAPELSDHAVEHRDRNMFHVVGRLRPGITFAAAEERLDAVTRQIEHDNGEQDNPDRSRRITVVTAGKLLPMRKQDLPFFTSFFLTLAGLVVLIACTNVATMMLARAIRRRREIAIRLALGAGRGRIVVQLLTESMLIAAAAGALGFALSAWLMNALSHHRMLPLPIPITYDFTADARVFFFTLAITMLTGLIFGLAPAWHATRVGLTPALKEGGHVQFHRFRRVSLRNVLIVAQVAASLTLLVVVGLLAIGIQTTVGIQQGIDANHRYLVAVDPVRDGVPPRQVPQFFRKFLDRVRALPGVDSACLTDTLPVAMNLAPWVQFSLIDDDGRAKSRLRGAAAKQLVGSDYFQTAGIRLLQGRAFTRQDETDSASAVIISETLARQYFRGMNPVGRQLELTSGKNQPGFGALPGNPDYRRGVLADGPRTFEIVGVAADVTNSLTANDEHPAIYFPMRPADYVQPSLQGTTVILRATAGSDVLRAVEREASSVDSRITPFDARSMKEHIDQFMMPLRIASSTYAIIGIFGLVLSSVGLAGVTAYSVSQRTHEIGVRMALGARAQNVLALVMKEGILLVAVGTALGMVGAWAASRLLAFSNASVGTVTSTSTSNPVLLVGAPLLLATLALIACYVPARRSLRVDPLIALRQE